jgi:hypothetical protein
LLAHCDRATSMACAALRRDSGVVFSTELEHPGLPFAYYGEAMAQVCGRLMVHVGCTKTCTFLEMTRILQVSDHIHVLRLRLHCRLRRAELPVCAAFMPHNTCRV